MSHSFTLVSYRAMQEYAMDFECADLERGTTRRPHAHLWARVVAVVLPMTYVPCFLSVAALAPTLTLIDARTPQSTRNR